MKKLCSFCQSHIYKIITNALFYCYFGQCDFFYQVLIFLPVKTFLPLHGPFPALKNDIGCLLLSKVDDDIMVLINGDNDDDDNYDLGIVVVDPLRASSHWR